MKRSNAAPQAHSSPFNIACNRPHISAIRSNQGSDSSKIETAESTVFPADVARMRLGRMPGTSSIRQSQLIARDGFVPFIPTQYTGSMTELQFQLYSVPQYSQIPSFISLSPLFQPAPSREHSQFASLASRCSSSRKTLCSLVKMCEYIRHQHIVRPRRKSCASRASCSAAQVGRAHTLRGGSP